MRVEDTRVCMKSYWEQHKSTTLESMMLDTNAKKLNELEVPEILEKAPDMAGKDVLELASGIGRYTGILSDRAKSVTAVEFIDEFHRENERANGHKGNVKFLCEDVCKLEMPPNSFDVIFSNWIFMYLSDEEVEAFAQKAVQWLRPGGMLFFRESCFRQSGNVKRNSNPTKYRHPNFYVNAFNSVISKEAGGLGYLNIESSSSVGVYRKLKNNAGQICFRYKKEIKQGETDASAVDTFQKFLDSQQYSETSITRYEKIFGKGYVSTGGQDTTTEFVDMLNLKKGEHVLDVGCGIGGGNFYMARKFGVSVVGIDLSVNMIYRAMEASMEHSDLDVEFEVADATTIEYPPESFDVIYSRDTILHIADKKTLFERFHKWLRPGGRVLISDYCCGDKEWTPHYAAYVKQRGYHLLTPAKYGQVLESAGFKNVTAEDRTEHFTRVLSGELERTLGQKEDFIKETSEEDYQAIIDGWRNKLQRCGEGNQKWGLFLAYK